MTPAITPKRQPSRYVGRLRVVSKSVQSVEAHIVMELRRARVCGSRPPSTPVPQPTPYPIQLRRILQKTMPTPEANSIVVKPRLLLNHSHDRTITGGSIYPAPKRAGSDQNRTRHGMGANVKSREPLLVAVDARDNDSPSESATRWGDVARVGREACVIRRRQDDEAGKTSLDGLEILSTGPLDSEMHLTKWRRRAVRGEEALRQLGQTREMMGMHIKDKRLRMAKDLVRRLAAEKKHLLAPAAVKAGKEQAASAAATGSAAGSARGEEVHKGGRSCGKQGKSSWTPVRRVPCRTRRSNRDYQGKRDNVPRRRLWGKETATALALSACRLSIDQWDSRRRGGYSLQRKGRKENYSTAAEFSGDVSVHTSDQKYSPSSRAKKRSFPAGKAHAASKVAAVPILRPKAFDANRRHRRVIRCPHTPYSDGDPSGLLEKPSPPSMPRRSYPPPWNAGRTAGLGVGLQKRGGAEGEGVCRFHARHSTGDSRFEPYNARGGGEVVSEPWIRDWGCPSGVSSSQPDLGSIASDDGECFSACTLSEDGRQREGDGVDDSKAKGCWLGPRGAFTRRTTLRPPFRGGPRAVSRPTPARVQCLCSGVPVCRRRDQIKGRDAAHKSRKGTWHRLARWKWGGAEDKGSRRARKSSATTPFVDPPPEPRQRKQKRPRWNSRFGVPARMAVAPRPAVNRCSSSRPPDCTQPAQGAGSPRATAHPCDCPSEADDVSARLAQLKQEHILHEIGRVSVSGTEQDNEYHNGDDDSPTAVITDEDDLGTSSNGARRLGARRGLEMIVSELCTMFSREPPRGRERRGGSIGNTHHGPGEPPRPEDVLPRVRGDRDDRYDTDPGMQGRRSDSGGVPASRGLLLEFVWPSTPQSADCAVRTEGATITAIAPPGREWPSESAHQPQRIGGRKVGRGDSGALEADESRKALVIRRPAPPTATWRTERAHSSHPTTLTRSIDGPLRTSNRCCRVNYLVLTLGFLRHMVEAFLADGEEQPQKAAGVTASGGGQGRRNQGQASTPRSTLWSDIAAALGRTHSFSAFRAEARGVNRSDIIHGRLLDTMPPSDLCRGLVPLIARAFRPPRNVFRRRKRDGSELGVFLGWAVRNQLLLRPGRPRPDVGARAAAADGFGRPNKCENGCDGEEGCGAKSRGLLSTSIAGGGKSQGGAARRGGKFYRGVIRESAASTTQSDASGDSDPASSARSDLADDVSSADASDRRYNSSTSSTTTFITEDAALSMSCVVVGGSASAETLSSLGSWCVSTEAGGSVSSSLDTSTGASDLHPAANDLSTLVAGGNGLGGAPRTDNWPYPRCLNLHILAEMQRANSHVRFPGLAEVARMYADELGRLAVSGGGSAADC